MHALYRAMHGPMQSVQGDKAIWRITTYRRAKVLYSLRPFHELGGSSLSLLQLQSKVQIRESQVQDGSTEDLDFKI